MMSYVIVEREPILEKLDEFEVWLKEKADSIKEECIKEKLDNPTWWDKLLGREVTRELAIKRCYSGGYPWSSYEWQIKNGYLCNDLRKALRISKRKYVFLSVKDAALVSDLYKNDT